MFQQKNRLTVSHAPFWHDGKSIADKNYNIMLAALIAVIPGLFRYGLQAVAVIALSISSAMVWELCMNKITKRPVTIGDGNAAMTGMLFGMLLPAVVPWWLVITGTFIAIVIGKEIFGGIGGNPFSPVLTGYAILFVSWGGLLDFNETLLNYDLDFGYSIIYPLTSLKFFGTDIAELISVSDLFIGNQIGGIGATCNIALLIGGIYLCIRGFIRWEISVSFIAGVFITAWLFKLSDPSLYAGPLFHLFTGFTMIGVFYLATEDSSSPVNFIPMLIYGAGCGIMTVLIRNIGAYVDGVVLGIIVMNLANPLLDKIRPKALRKVV